MSHLRNYLRGYLTALKIVYVTRHAALINLQRFCTKGPSKQEKQEPLWANMNVEEFGSSRERLTLIDVREPEELRYHGCFSGAINIPLGEVEEALKLNPEEFQQKYGHHKPATSDDDIVFHCLRGMRSHTALIAAHQLGYSKARHLEGGWKAWIKHILENEL